jgi:transcriptional regulator with XRE-family HTH domain
MNTRTMRRVPVIDLGATGRNITKMRKATGFSVRDLQEMLGFTNPQTIYKWQNGVCLPTIDNLVILAAILGVTVDEILVIEDEDQEGIWDKCTEYSNYPLRVA